MIDHIDHGPPENAKEMTIQTPVQFEDRSTGILLKDWMMMMMMTIFKISSLSWHTILQPLGKVLHTFSSGFLLCAL